MVFGIQPVRPGQLYVMRYFADKTCLYSSKDAAIRHVGDIQCMGNWKNIYEEVAGPIDGAKDYYVLRDGWGDGKHYYSIGNNMGPFDYNHAENVRDACKRLDPRSIGSINHSYRVVADVTNSLMGKQPKRTVVCDATPESQQHPIRNGGDIHYHNDTHLHIHIQENVASSVQQLQEVFGECVKIPPIHDKDMRLVESTEC